MFKSFVNMNISKDQSIKCRYCTKQVSEGNEYFYIYEPSELNDVSIDVGSSNKIKKDIYPVCDSPECLKQLLAEKNLDSIGELNLVPVDNMNQSIDYVCTYKYNRLVFFCNNFSSQALVKSESPESTINEDAIDNIENDDSDENFEVEFLEDNFIEPETYLKMVELESIKYSFKDQQCSNFLCVVSSKYF